MQVFPLTKLHCLTDQNVLHELLFKGKVRSPLAKLRLMLLLQKKGVPGFLYSGTYLSKSHPCRTDLHRMAQAECGKLPGPCPGPHPIRPASLRLPSVELNGHPARPDDKMENCQKGGTQETEGGCWMWGRGGLGLSPALPGGRGWVVGEMQEVKEQQPTQKRTDTGVSFHRGGGIGHGGLCGLSHLNRHGCGNMRFLVTCPSVSLHAL